MISDELGFAILIGIFVLAGVLLAAKSMARRAREERLRTLGFEPCESEAPRLLALFTELAGGHGPEREKRYEVARCYRKPVGSGFVYRFSAADLSPRKTADDERAPVAPVTDVFLFDLRVELRAGAQAVLRPCSLFLSSLSGGLLHGFLAKLVALRPPGQPLELPAQHRDSFLGAFGAARGKLEEHLGAPLIELAARAGAAGFFAAHFRDGRAALEVPQELRDVDAQWSTVIDWVAA